MRDIYFIMQTENNKSLICILVDKEYKFYYSNGDDPLENMKVVRPNYSRSDKSRQTYFFFDDFAFEGLYSDESDVVCYVVPFCKHCGSFDVIRKDFNRRKVFDRWGKLKSIKMKRYECKKCGRKSQTELTGAYKPYAKIPDHVKDYAGLSLHNGDKTLRQHSADIELFANVPISHETVRKSLFIDNVEDYKKWEFDYSGYSSYDAQWIPQNGKFVYRLTLVDIEYYLPIAEAIVEKEDDDVIKNFIKKSLPGNKRIGIITDSKKGYDKVMRELGFKYHQHCVFHLLQRINDLINEETNKFKRQYKNELKELNPEYSKSKLNDLAKKEAKEYRKQFEPYNDEISDIFEQEKYENAEKHIRRIKNKINEYPQFLSNYLNKNFFPEYKRYIVFLKKEVMDKLEKTNNKCENYIGKILDKSRKGDFKTKNGVFNHICHRADGWIKKRKIKLESKSIVLN